jgi:hypothetical protein
VIQAAAIRSNPRAGTLKPAFLTIRAAVPKPRPFRFRLAGSGVDGGVTVSIGPRR